MKKLALATAIALSLGANTQVFALTSTLLPTVLFDRDGAGGDPTPISIDGFNWLPDSLLAQGLVHTAPGSSPGSYDNTLNDQFTLYGQGRLADFSCGGGTCPPLAGQFTFTFAVSMVVTTPPSGTPSPTAFTAAVDPNGDIFDFHMYFDPTANANESDGTGYDDSPEILKATFTRTTFDNLTFGFDNTTDLRKLDSYLTDQWDGTDSNPTRVAAGTYPGSGTLHFNMDVESADPAFFTSPDVTGLDLTGTIRTPFDAANPSALVNSQAPDLGIDTMSGTFTGGTDPASTGTRIRNDFTCATPPEPPGDCDFMMQADGSSTEQVPEPASLALLGLGLSGLAARRRRKLV